jgi:hypothetical protein
MNPAGLEPATCRLEDDRSLIQLSYGLGRNDEVGTMNAEVKTSCLSFIVPTSSPIASAVWLREKESNLHFTVQSRASCRLDDPET